MTNRERIIKHLEDNGMDLWWLGYSEVKDKYQRPGTIVVSGWGTDRWHEIREIADREKKIQVKHIRDKFEWQYEFRIIWIGEK